MAKQTDDKTPKKHKSSKPGSNKKSMQTMENRVAPLLVGQTMIRAVGVSTFSAPPPSEATYASHPAETTLAKEENFVAIKDQAKLIESDKVTYTADARGVKEFIERPKMEAHYNKERPVELAPVEGTIEKRPGGYHLGTLPLDDKGGAESTPPADTPPTASAVGSPGTYTVAPTKGVDKAVEDAFKDPGKGKSLGTSFTENESPTLESRAGDRANDIIRRRMEQAKRGG